MVSKKIKLIPPYLFNEIDKLKKSIENPIDFGIGDPDMPTPAFIVKEMEHQLKIKENHRYPSYEGILELREEISKYFKKRFNAEIDPENEILILIGSKEGIAHSLEAFLDKNDEVLIPSICYPVYRTQTLLKGGIPVEFPVCFDNYFIPYFSDIKKKLSSKSKVLFLNYPNNPSGASVEKNFYDQAVDFALKQNLIIMNDNVYSDVYFSKVRPPSIMQSKQAKECSIEFHSFSKTFNMTGWRIGYAVGGSHLIKALKQIKMNTDSGVFVPIQKAALAGLKSIDSHVMRNNIIIKKRVDLLCEALGEKDFEFHKPKAAFYVFAKTKKNMKSAEFTEYLLREAGIVTTPGVGFGRDGDDFVRFSLTLSDADLKQGIKRIKKLKL
ncbi:MAG: aminotransferase class I/II-fold pyridoxal phosphate-dependent enzyme [bacterium]